jgi:AcrR family transcriptional regulator
MRMPSPKASARTPQRERGRLRVAALLDAAGAVFADKGFDGATMTEIAARAGASIGSLYQFFPTKELVAEAVMDRDTEALIERLAAFEAAAAKWSLVNLADRLAPALLDFRSDHPAFAVLLETPGAPAKRAAEAGKAVRARVRAILASAAPGRSAAVLDAAAAAVQQVMKAAVVVKAGAEPIWPATLKELKTMLRLYLVDRLGKGRTKR